MPSDLRRLALAQFGVGVTMRAGVWWPVPIHGWRLARVSLLRPKNESQRWVSLTLVTMGIWIAMIIVLAVVPSWWLYFADGTLKWTDNFTLPLGIRKIVLSKQVIRDLIVVGWYGVALVAAGRLIGIWNKRNPRVLPDDEGKREATGGYR
jgi:hypothetical protein